MTLELVPLTRLEAQEFIRQHHRHHKSPPGDLFRVGVASAGKVVGVGIVSRPTARMSNDGRTVEITRIATDGTRNACSMLYRALIRAAWALGWYRVITYTLPEEGGASLRAAGLRCLGERGGGRWSRASRPRVDTHPLQRKMLWEATP